MPLVNLEHDFSNVESPDPFAAGALISINRRHAEKGSGYARLAQKAAERLIYSNKAVSHSNRAFSDSSRVAIY